MSLLQSETARANGAKSRGPVTPEGRAASSRNSLRHGFTTRSVVLPTESQEDFQSLLDSYTHQFRPQGGVEMDLVQTMAAARWRLRRLCTIETALLNNEMTRNSKDIKRAYHSPDDLARLAWVFRDLANHGQSLALLMRYEGTLNRSYDRAFKQLLLLQAHRPRPNEPKPAQATPCEEPADQPVQDHPQPNEPKPVPTPASVPVASTMLTPASEHRNDPRIQPRIQKDEVSVDAG
jgi:hypothetical protein